MAALPEDTLPLVALISTADTLVVMATVLKKLVKVSIAQGLNSAPPT